MLHWDQAGRVEWRSSSQKSRSPSIVYRLHFRPYRFRQGGLMIGPRERSEKKATGYSLNVRNAEGSRDTDLETFILNIRSSGVTVL